MPGPEGVVPADLGTEEQSSAPPHPGARVRPAPVRVGDTLPVTLHPSITLRQIIRDHRLQPTTPLERLVRPVDQIKLLVTEPDITFTSEERK